MSDRVELAASLAIRAAIAAVLAIIFHFAGDVPWGWAVFAGIVCVFLGVVILILPTGGD